MGDVAEHDGSTSEVGAGYGSVGNLTRLNGLAKLRHGTTECAVCHRTTAGNGQRIVDLRVAERTGVAQTTKRERTAAKRARVVAVKNVSLDVGFGKHGVVVCATHPSAAVKFYNLPVCARVARQFCKRDARVVELAGANAGAERAGNNVATTNAYARASGVRCVGVGGAFPQRRCAVPLGKLPVATAEPSEHVSVHVGAQVNRGGISAQTQRVS